MDDTRPVSGAGRPEEVMGRAEGRTLPGVAAGAGRPEVVPRAGDARTGVEVLGVAGFVAGREEVGIGRPEGERGGVGSGFISGNEVRAGGTAAGGVAAAGMAARGAAAGGAATGGVAAGGAAAGAPVAGRLLGGSGGGPVRAVPMPGSVGMRGGREEWVGRTPTPGVAGGMTVLPRRAGGRFEPGRAGVACPPGVEGGWEMRVGSVGRSSGGDRIRPRVFVFRAHGATRRE